ncbi:MAG TPA: 30S ribosomal protein S6 [Clostridiales bacterium UBA8153]|jgi:small subunit ribosomal protein S6|nr:30S ribosomal protein S6 [Clostridiales bacterium UBA8153]
MRHYELMYITRPDLDEEALTGVLERFSELIAKSGGEVKNIDKWGKRRLSYEISDFREGHYVVVDFLGEPAVANEVSRVMKITDQILRHLIVSKE